MASLADLKKRQKELDLDLKYYLDKSDLTTAEGRKWDSLLDEYEKVRASIDFEQKRFDYSFRMSLSEHGGFGMSSAEINTLRSFSFLKFMREISDGVLTGLEQEMHQEGINELRSEVGQGNKGFCIPRKVLAVAGVRASMGQNITTAGDGGSLTQMLPLLYRDALKNALILPSLGATYLTGLSGNLPIVRGGLFSATWAAEGTSVDTGKASLGKTIMSAKRLTATGAFSRELMNQSSIDVENWVRQGLVDANAQAIMDAAINGLTANHQPVGILNTASIGDVPGGTNGAAPTWAHVIALETAVAASNADLGKLGYLTNSKVRGLLKQTLKASGVPGYIWENNQINSYPTASSNVVPSTLTKGITTGVGVCSAIIFGNWADLMIGEWGGLDIIVDPYTLKKQGDIEITVNTFADIAVAHPESFAAMKDALTN
jgi:hypothetical protein